MIVVILAGGLGNQMFEYAAARALALRTGTEVVLNTHMGFERDKAYHRVFALDTFNIKYCKNRLLSFDFPLGFVVERISRKLGRHLLCPWYKYLFENKTTRESVRHFNCNSVIMFGGWINQEYYEDYKDVIRSEFSPVSLLPVSTEHYLREIDNSEIPIVAMGVRVYQEIKDEKVRNGAFFYTKGNFYVEAITYLKNRIGKFKLFIFTQEEDWVKENVNLKGVEFEFVKTSQSDRDAINDMFIMSKCHHYIIANSSFYYWGCWLNPNENKIVVVPQRWTNCTLDNWIKI